MTGPHRFVDGSRSIGSKRVVHLRDLHDLGAIAGHAGGDAHVDGFDLGQAQVAGDDGPAASPTTQESGQLLGGEPAGIALGADVVETR